MPKARTSAMLPITSTSSPSTDAAFDAKLWCRAEPRLASRYRMSERIADASIRPPAISGLTVTIITIAPSTAMHGGRTFHAITFSEV